MYFFAVFITIVNSRVRVIFDIVLCIAELSQSIKGFIEISIAEPVGDSIAVLVIKLICALYKVIIIPIKIAPRLKVERIEIIGDLLKIVRINNSILAVFFYPVIF